MTTTTSAASDHSLPRPAAARPPRGGAGVFVALTFAISWLSWGAAVLLPGSVADPGIMALFLVGGTGPTLAALVLGLRGRRGPRTVVARRAGTWTTVAVGLGFLPAMASTYLPTLAGAAAPSSTEASVAVSAAGGPALFIVSTLLMGPLSEEFGWRGYAQPRMRYRRSPAVTSLALGAVWGAWHLPLFFLAGTWQESVGLLSPEGLLILAGAVPLSALAWFVSERLQGGVPAAVLLHAATNASLTLFPPSSPGAAAVLAGVLVGAAVLVLVVGRTPRPVR